MPSMSQLTESKDSIGAYVYPFDKKNTIIEVDLMQEKKTKGFIIKGKNKILKEKKNSNSKNKK